MRHSIPAGVGEKMQYIVHDFNDNTIRFVLRYPVLLPPDMLREAALALVQRTDVLHASFVPGRMDARWQLHEPRAEDCFAFLQVSGDPLEAALHQALQGVGAQEPVKLRCILVHGDTDSALAVLISHLCVDGSDGRYLLQRLCEACRMLEAEGSCAQLHVKDGSRAAEQVYTGLSAQERRQLMKDPRTGVKSVFPYPTEDPGQPAVVRRLIPASVLSAAHDRAKADGATLNDLLLAAAYHAIAGVTAQEPGAPLSIMSMMDLRRHCEGGDSPGLCNLTGALATLLPQGPAADLPATLREIAAQTRRAKEDPLAGLYGMPLLHGAARRIPLGLLLAAAGRLYGSMAMGLTNIGRLPGEELRLAGHEPSEGWFGGPIKKKPGMQISCASFGGSCSLSIWGHAAPGDLPLLQHLLDDMSGMIAAYAGE